MERCNFLGMNYLKDKKGVVKVTARKQKKSGRIIWKRWSMWRTSGELC